MSLPSRSGRLAMATLMVVSISCGANETRELGAHAHGHGTLDVVSAGEELEIELRVPAVHVVGFEHEPGTDAQRKAVDEALAVFRNAGALFTLPAAAGCRVESAHASFDGMEYGGEPEHDMNEPAHGHESDAHAEEAHAEKDHAELHAEYRFHCDDPGALRRVDLTFFDHLSDIDEIEARVVTDTAQSAAELTPDNAAVELRRE